MSKQEGSTKFYLDWKFWFGLVLGGTLVTLAGYSESIYRHIDQHYLDVAIEKAEMKSLNDYSLEQQYEMFDDGNKWDCGDNMQYGTDEECYQYWESMKDLLIEKGEYAMYKQLDEDGHLSNTEKFIIRDNTGIHLPLTDWREHEALEKFGGLDVSFKSSDVDTLYYEEAELNWEIDEEQVEIHKQNCLAEGGNWKGNICMLDVNTDECWNVGCNPTGGVPLGDSEIEENLRHALLMYEIAEVNGLQVSPNCVANFQMHNDRVYMQNDCTKDYPIDENRELHRAWIEIINEDVP